MPVSAEIYRKEMLRAFAFPVALFFLLPLVVVVVSAGKLSALDLIRLLVPFPLTLFGAGYLLAPLLRT